MVHRIKEFYRKIVERYKGRKKKNYNCNWPELNYYCGCCKLSTGIYIKSILTLVITTIAILFNSRILNLLINSPFLNNGNLTILDDYLNVSDSNVEKHIEAITWILHYMAVYYIIWICFKIFYIIVVIISVYGVFRKKSMLLKVMLCISIPNWIIDFFVSIIGMIFMRPDIKFLLLISNFAEGYNILAVKSEYTRLRGKSRLVQDSDLYEPRVTVIYPNGSNISGPPYIHPHGRQLHCRTCSCYNNTDNSDPGRLQTSNNEAENIQQTDVVNNVETNVVNTEVADAGAIASSTRATRPNTLDYSLQNVRENKIDMADIPVIYDEQQLNVGTSPVVEDRLQVQEDVFPSGLGDGQNSLN